MGGRGRLAEADGHDTRLESGGRWAMGASGGEAVADGLVAWFDGEIILSNMVVGHVCQCQCSSACGVANQTRPALARP